MAIKVARLVNYPTRYELVIERGSLRYLVAYTAKKNRVGLMHAIRNRGQALLALTKLDEEARFTFTSTTAANLGEWTVRFTHRTQRDAICTQSELPYVGDVAVSR